MNALILVLALSTPDVIYADEIIIEQLQFIERKYDVWGRSKLLGKNVYFKLAVFNYVNIRGRWFKLSNGTRWFSKPFMIYRCNNGFLLEIDSTHHVICKRLRYVISTQEDGWLIKSYIEREIINTIPGNYYRYNYKKLKDPC